MYEPIRRDNRAHFLPGDRSTRVPPRIIGLNGPGSAKGGSKKRRGCCEEPLHHRSSRCKLRLVEHELLKFVHTVHTHTLMHTHTCTHLYLFLSHTKRRSLAARSLPGVTDAIDFRYPEFPDRFVYRFDAFFHGDCGSVCTHVSWI